MRSLRTVADFPLWHPGHRATLRPLAPDRELESLTFLPGRTPRDAKIEESDNRVERRAGSRVFVPHDGREYAVAPCHGLRFRCCCSFRA